MKTAHQNLITLTYQELQELLESSTILVGHQAEAFGKALKEVPLYLNEPRLQMAHSKALLHRMTLTPDFEETLVLSHVQESVPSFHLSLTLRQYFARGLVVAAAKNPTTSVISRALARIYKLPSFISCPVLQRCAGELLLEGVAASEDAETAHEFLKQYNQLPGINYSNELQKLRECAAKQAKRVGRDPIVKIDLNQKFPGAVRAVGKLLGMGDFRMKVELRGLEYYDQAVVRVPAFTERAARKAAENFIADFLRDQTGEEQRSAKIVDIYPPGSAWESGRHPVLNLKAK